jgi:cell division septum initiation protein DivIVA
MSSSNEGGLALFDEAASAAGNFPSALRGYERSAVDDYVRSLEAALVQNRRHVAGLQSQITSLQQQVDEANDKLRSPDVDYSNLGGRASDILRLAEEQAREVLDNANVDAERAREQARRDADEARDEALRAGGDLKANGVAEIERLRARGQEDLRRQVEKVTAESEAILAAARREAEALQRAADHEAQTMRQNAYLDTEGLRRTVEREVAETRQEIAEEKEAAIGHLRSVHDDAVARTSALLTEATEYHRQATARLEADIAEATRIRSEAEAEAERVKVKAIQEAEDRIVAARKQAAAITDRTQQEFAWRKQQLRRETDLLGQRKQAVLNQLASLSALAEQTAHGFPDLEDLDDFDGEQGDRTIMMPPSSSPALPATQGNEQQETTGPETTGQEDVSAARS